MTYFKTRSAGAVRRDAGSLVDRAPRLNVFLGAEVAGFHQNGATRHRIRDLSSTGVRIDSAEHLQPGATVLVSVGALKAAAATVIWTLNDLAGLQFATPINPDDARARVVLPVRK
ncbi:MAG: PilZ domain-containing protein [Alphaproteobacteria bacterium]|nr:MAG: PilZ domain-containing protein [Alphaproteobacteria bacterium]